MDILVVGGGPSGCAAALSALNEGAKNVTIVESQPYDRHRIGEILLTNTIMDFVRMGIDDDLYPYIEKYGWNKKFAASYVHGKDRTPWQVVNNHPGLDINAVEGSKFPKKYIDPESGIWYTLVVRRHEFDEALREICEKKGINIIHGKLIDCKMANKRDPHNSSILSVTILDTEGNTIKAAPQFTIDATGQQAFLGNNKLKNRAPFGDADLRASYAYLADVDYEAAVERGFYKNGANILSYEDGWVWLAYLGKGQTTIGIVSRKWDKEQHSFWEKLKRLPEYDLFKLGEARTVNYKNEPAEADHSYVHTNYRSKTENFAGLNWGCSGDAAIFLDPLLSQGVTLAIAYGMKIGTIAQKILSHEVGAEEAMISYHNAYIKEVEILNKVVTLWYKSDFSVEDDWVKTAAKISKMFGREIGEDVEAFRWISNLENVHKLFDDGDLGEFLTDLRDVNNIKLIHEFEETLA